MSSVLIALLAVLGDPTIAVPASPPAAAAPAAQTVAATPAASKGSRVICRQSEETGTRLGGSKTCMTADQWRQQDDEMRMDMTRAKAFQPH